MSPADAPTTSPLPPEIISEIVGAVWDDTSRITEDTSRKTLLTLTCVSRVFYTLARKRLWEFITLRYYPYRSSGFTHRNIQIHDILRDNSDLRADIRALTIEILTDDLEDIALDVIANPSTVVHRTLSEEAKEDRDSFLQALYLLAASELRNLTITTHHHPRLSYALPISAVLDEETLFALTALRVSPALESCAFLYLVDPPPALIFGNPRTDTIHQVSLLTGFSRSPFDNSNHDYTVERQSTSFDIPDGVYDATKRAISYFAAPDRDPAPLVIFPKVTVLWYVAPERRQHILSEYLIERGSPSKPWGGHMPLLEDLSITALGYNFSPSDVDQDREDSTFIHAASPTVKSLLLNGVPACRGLKNLAYLPQLSKLSFICTLSSRHLDEYGWRVELSRLLETIPPSQPLRSLSIEFHTFSASVEEYQTHILSWAEFWTGLDNTFMQLATTLRSRRLAVEIRMLVDIAGDESVERAFELTNTVVQGLLPRCRESSGVHLDINAKLWR